MKHTDMKAKWYATREEANKYASWYRGLEVHYLTSKDMYCVCTAKQWNDIITGKAIIC